MDLYTKERTESQERNYEQESVSSWDENDELAKRREEAEQADESYRFISTDSTIGEDTNPDQDENH